ncbi:MAG: hypothetical protein J1G38_05350 [Clostridiales bacterium]|nr:hypothetical protein [Clostridiales bacterium]
MAKDATEKKKRKNIVQRMMFGNENKPDLTPERMKMTKWEMFKELFFHRFGTIVALNMLTALFAMPAVLVVILFYLNISVNSSYVPYSANLGIGYPVIVDAASRGAMMTFSYQVIEFAALVPCIAIFALGVAGNLYVIRKLIWAQPSRTVRDFFRGIGKCWLGAVFMGLAFGLTLLFFVFSLGYFDTYYISTPLKVVSILLSVILLIVMSLFTAFFMTQNAAFKMRPMVLIRNSFLFVFGTHIMSIIFVGIALLPMYLAFIPGITMLLFMLYAFLGFSFTTLVISLYCHSCYERFLYDKIDASDSAAVYTKRVNDVNDVDEKQQAKQKKQQPSPYKNPKKRKKSIDEGTSITPLTPMFRREDLERLEKEHEQVLTESDDKGDAESVEALDKLADSVNSNAEAMDSNVESDNPAAASVELDDAPEELGENDK